MTTLDKNQQSEVELVTDKGSWPMVYCLPMKKRKASGGPDLGTILARDVTEILLEPVDVLLTYNQEQIAAVAKKKYESVEAMVLDGWVVD